MYSLAPRFPCTSCKQDTAVDPTLYYIDSYESSCKLKGASYAFAGKHERFKTPKDEERPSPAHYYPKYRKKRILGGTSMQYRSPRICIVPKKSPPLPFSCDSTMYIPKKIIRKDLIKRVMRRECPGVEIGEVSMKSQMVLKEASASISLPTYLTFPGETNKASLKYRGPRWAESKTKRQGLEMNTDTPGPASYNILSKAFPKKPKRHEPRIRHKPPPCKPPIPTEKPGVEEICSQLTLDQEFELKELRYDYIFKKVSHNRNPNGLWGNTQRFAYNSNDNPPPWAYDTALPKCNRRITKITPFESCAPRFNRISDSDLGPASYEQNYNTIMEKLCKALPQVKGTLRAPFGSTKPRLVDKPSKDRDNNNSQLNQTDLTSFITVIPISVAPRTTVKRKLVIDHDKENIPVKNLSDDEMYQIGPCLKICEEDTQEEPLVNLPDVYTRYLGKVSHRKQLDNEGFLSTTYTSRSTWMDTDPLAKDVNWPEKMDDARVFGGALKMDVPIYGRKAKPKLDESWGFYDVHAEYSSSVYRKTHNQRLKHEELVVKPPDTREEMKYILKCYIPKEILNA